MATKLSELHGPLSIEYTLPSGEVVTIGFDDRYDTRLQPTIDFQLQSGEVVWAVMRLEQDQRQLLEKLQGVFMESVGAYQVECHELDTAYELHKRRLVEYQGQYVWITFNGRKLLSKLP